MPEENAELNPANLIPSAARAVDITSADQVNGSWRGGHFVVDVSTRAGAQTVRVTIQGAVPASTRYYTVLQSTALSTGRTILKVYPGLPGVANAIANDVLPRTWRINSTLSSTDSIKYGVSAHLIL